MKLIIDLPELTYEAIMARDWENSEFLYNEEIKAIHDGVSFDKVLQEIKEHEEAYQKEAKETQDDIDCGISIGLKKSLDILSKY